MASTPRELLIVLAEKPSGNDIAMGALADFLGLEVLFRDFMRLLSEGFVQGRMQDNRMPAAISGGAVGDILRHGLMERFRSFLAAHASSLLVYGVAPRHGVAEGLSRLTGGAIRGVKAPGSIGHSYEVAADGREVCGQLSGLRIGPVTSDFDHVFVMSGAPAKTFVSIDGEPFFVMTPVDGYPVFLTGASHVADVRTPVSSQPDVKAVFSPLLPAAMYLKGVFKAAAWRQPRSRACLIVDDPLLKERYGFLHFRSLVDLMDAHDFTTSIGFIPWNFRRTGRETARLFRARPDRVSLCVHGCDHTQDEFGLPDREGLHSMVRTASDRMERHGAATGIAFDNVMVFPQGVFSIPAMEALKSNNYLAAVNWDVFPVDFQGPLEMKAFLEPAVTAFGDFPLFLRRLPEEVDDIAMDLFWGRPALIMAHHAFFRDGHHKAVETANRINALEGGVEWRSPAEIIKRSYLSRKEPDGATGIKSYVAETVIENPAVCGKRYILTKKEPAVPLRVTLASGKEPAYEHRNGELCLALDVGPHGRESVTLVYPNDCPRPGSAGGFRRAAGIRMRRYLSEIRDNHLSRNDRLLSLAVKLKDRLLP